VRRGVRDRWVSARAVSSDDVLLDADAIIGNPPDGYGLVPENFVLASDTVSATAQIDGYRACPKSISSLRLDSGEGGIPQGRCRESSIQDRF
jgi:hypothetical protein